MMFSVFFSFFNYTLSHADSYHFALIDAKIISGNVDVGIPTVKDRTETQKTYTPRDFHIETRNVVKQDRRRSTLSKRLLPSMGAEKSVSMSTHSPTAQVSQSSLMPARPFPVFEDGSAFC